MLAVKNFCFVILSVIFLSGFFSYQATISPIGLNIYHLLLIFLVIFLSEFIFKKTKKSLFFTDTTLFVSAYLSILIVYFIFSSYGSEIWQIFVSCFAGVIFFASIYLLANDTKEIIKKTFPILLIFSCFLQFYDFLNPGFLVPYWFPEANPGRAAGLFMNANQAGYALILFMSVVLSFCTKRTIQYCLIIFIPAIIITFSRSTWLLTIVLFLIFRGKLKFSTFLLSILMVIIFFIFGFSYFFNTDNLLDINSAAFAFENIASRLDIFSIFNDSTRTFTDDSRYNLIFFSLSEIEKNILFGNGLGHTYMWNNDVGPHNMYLYFFVEFGLIGFLFYLSVCGIFLYKSFVMMDKSLKKFNSFIAMFLIIGGFFSHTFFIDFQPVAILAIASALNHGGA